MNLKGVIFDFGETLAYSNEEDDRRYREGIVSVLLRFGYKTTLDDLSLKLDKAYQRSTKGEVRDISEFWKLLLQSLGISENPMLIQDLTDLRSRHIATLFKLYVNNKIDTTTVLSILSKKYKLALVSNCSVGLSDILRELRLTDFFECIVLSYEVEVRKPDRQIYFKALKKLKIEPEESIFVSDRISDLEGARNVGLQTLLVDQGQNTTYEAKDPDFKPDYKCNHLFEIMKFL